ncbi:protein hold'em [Toxorhynchites rutilus septentrionalis]|uniref:protein hold'em n=1 Tax=Toxorhynchites rutilus septentrionalis TaxID=329112 RepID=UPI00247AAC68|nr:protein hold'em [Toxorhynchites rutilus septentrionalis]
MTDVIVTKRINQISHDSRNFIIVGVIIAKSDPKFFDSASFSSGNDSGSARGVITLTIRDSERDTINSTIWGSQFIIDSYDSQFHIGDVVTITKAKVGPVGHDKSEQFKPTTTSAFSLSFAEQDGSRIKLYEGHDIDQFKRLLAVAPVPAAETYPLADIASGGQSISGRSVNVLVVVQNIRARKQIVIAKTGKIKYLREVIVMDASHAGMSMKFWNHEYVERIEKWIPLTTVLLITDVRIEYNQYYKAICLGMNSKTIVTEDPAIEEGDHLLVHAMKATGQDSDMTSSLTSNAIDPNTINSVMTIQQILDRAEGDLKDDQEQFAALCYAVITKFDLDGYSRITSRKCLNCKTMLRQSEERCNRTECLHNPYNISVYFDIPVDMTDHTGTLSNCRLTSQAAENTLNCKVEAFLKMSDLQKGKLKWRFLLERCALKFVIKRKSPIRFQTMVSIVECVIAKPQEVESKIKVY